MDRQQPVPGLGDVSGLPAALLQTLTDLVERGEPLAASQTSDGLTTVTQGEILARLQALHAPAPAEPPQAASPAEDQHLIVDDPKTSGFPAPPSSSR